MPTARQSIYLAVNVNVAVAVQESQALLARGTQAAAFTTVAAYVLLAKSVLMMILQWLAVKHLCLVKLALQMCVDWIKAFIVKAIRGWYVFFILNLTVGSNLLHTTSSTCMLVSGFALLKYGTA